MLKVEIVTIGKDKDHWVTEGTAHYNKLLKKYCRLSLVYHPHIKNSASFPPAKLKSAEGDIFLKMPSVYTVALYDKAKIYSSVELSSWLEKRAISAQGTIRFLIGGAYGLSDEVLRKADETISLSPLTFSHQLVRLILLEQLYRAFSISHNTDYHK